MNFLASGGQLEVVGGGALLAFFLLSTGIFKPTHSHLIWRRKRNVLMDLFLQLRGTIYDRGDKLHFNERQIPLYFKLQISLFVSGF